MDGREHAVSVGPDAHDDVQDILFRAGARLRRQPRQTFDGNVIGLPVPKPRIKPRPAKPVQVFKAPSARPATSKATLPPPIFKRATYRRRRALSDILLERGAVAPFELQMAEMEAKDRGRPLESVLLAEGLLTEAALTQARAEQFKMPVARPLPDNSLRDDLARQLPMRDALAHRAIPWLRMGNKTLIATTRPEDLEALDKAIPDSLRPCQFAIVSDTLFDERIRQVHGPKLARQAECRVPQRFSCRLSRDNLGGTFIAMLIVGIAAATVVWPMAMLGTMTALAFVVTIVNVTMRLLALRAMNQGRGAAAPFRTVRPMTPGRDRLPVISLLVPLHREPEIAAALTGRLGRLDYPRSLLDVMLVVEEDDTLTREALATQDLPPWMRVIAVPDGQPRTKPRAMNYAMTFARGSIVGVYDAEDAPAPDQLRFVAARFRTAPPQVACLQGQLDYYNPDRNWMARCFTMEYATWFRLILPGIARLGLVIPLGGTTLFFRRSALDAIGGWDAHNVTEDADLGVRLARMGLRTEMIETTTLEEANASPIAWVKQRSRWMKGYILTWAVHMRRPVKLYRDLGLKRFVGFHVLFMGSILNAALLPALWSLIVLPFGIYHPIQDWLPAGSLWGLAVGMGALTLLQLAVTVAACKESHHRQLRVWAPTLEFYFPLASLAVLKALVEIVFRPFHWDKTCHGHFGGADHDDLAVAPSGTTPHRRTPRPTVGIAPDPA